MTARQFPDPRTAAFLFTAAREGGDKPAGTLGDPNHAFRGVNQRTYDAHRQKHGLPTQDVTLLSAAEQAAIYDDYWARGRCAEIAAHSGALALCHFDAVFNGGGVEILEREIGELTPDQVLTDDELAAVVSLLAPYNVFPDGETGEAGACGAYCEARLARFRRLHNAAAEPGWEVRLNRVASYCDLTWRVT